MAVSRQISQRGNNILHDMVAFWRDAPQHRNCGLCSTMVIFACDYHKHHGNVKIQILNPSEKKSRCESIVAEKSKNIYILRKPLSEQLTVL